MIPREYQLVTVFGGAGFIGRYVCERLMEADARVRVACREPRLAHFIQPLGQIGQFGFVRTDLTNAKSVRKAVEGATAVVNLVGAFKHMRAVHATGAETVAKAAAEAGVKALVQVSAIGADPDSPSEYGRTKAAGEEAVRSAFPNATIIRPSVVFGSEDDFTNRLARFGGLPFLPLIKPDCKLQPVFVEDLAKAIAAAAVDPKAHGGKTYEIVGPNVLTMREIAETTLRLARQEAEPIDLPDFASSALSWLGFMPGAPLTRDQWLMLQRHNIAAEGSRGLEAFGITPTPLAAVAEEWLNRYWRGGRFAMRTPPENAA